METIVNSKGLIVIPSKIRKQLGIMGGTYLQIDVNTVTGNMPSIKWTRQELIIAFNLYCKIRWTTDSIARKIFPSTSIS